MCKALVDNSYCSEKKKVYVKEKKYKGIILASYSNFA